MISNFLQKTAKYLRENDIDAIVWKNLEASRLDILNSRKNIEIDLYISRSHIGRFEILVKNLGYIELESFVVKHPFVRHFFAIVDHQRVHLNVYLELITGESQAKNYNLTYGFEIAEDTNFFGFSVLSSIDYKKLFLLRYFLKLGSLVSIIRYFLDRKDYQLESKGVSNTVEFSPSHGLSASFWSNLNSLSNNNIHSLLLTVFLLKFLLRGREIRGFFKQFLFRYWTLSFRIFNKIFLKRKRCIANKEGFIVAIVGSDGTGKSTLVDGLKKKYDFFDSLVLAVGRLDSMPSVGGILFKFFLKLKKLFSSYSRRDTSEIKSLSNRDTQENLFFCLKSCYVAYSRYRILGVANRARSKGYFVILDRYPSLSVNGMDGPRISTNGKYALLSKLERCIYDACSLPDLLIQLSVQVEVAIQRNTLRIKEFKETDDEIRSRHMIYSNSNYDVKNKIMIDASLDIDNVLAAAHRKIWMSL